MWNSLGWRERFTTIIYSGPLRFTEWIYIKPRLLEAAEGHCGEEDFMVGKAFFWWNPSIPSYLLQGEARTTAPKEETVSLFQWQLLVRVTEWRASVGWGNMWHRGYRAARRRLVMRAMQFSGVVRSPRLTKRLLVMHCHTGIPHYSYWL